MLSAFDSPVLRLAHRADDFLRADGLFSGDASTAGRTRTLLALILLFGPLYGLAMGSFSAVTPDRALQMAFTAAKMPLLLLGTTCLCLPVFFVVNSVLGLRDEWRAAGAAILAGQASLSIALAALSPLTLVWYASDIDYRAALLFNAAIFALATVAAQLVMRREYRRLIARRPAHRLTLWFWIATYAFVGIQMGWMLRPFIGDPEMPPAFFRPEPFSNAYVVVWHLIAG